MTDEQDIRDLLSQAAELPDSVQPPVGRLIERGRARRTRRAALSAASAAIVVAVVATLPSVLSSAVRGPAARHVPPSGLVGGLTQTGPGPSAAALARFRWSALPPSPLGPRAEPQLTWTGRELIEIGGASGKGRGGNDAAAFNPATGTWRRLPPAPGAVGLTNAVTAWTGHVLFVTNNQVPNLWRADLGAVAGLYDPATNHWTATNLPVRMGGATRLAAVWTGQDVVVAGTTQAGRIDAAAYNPVTHRWTMISPSVPAGHPASFITTVATSSRLIVFSHWSYDKREGKNGGEISAGVDVLAMGETGHWTTITGTRLPQGHVVATPFFTGSEILVSPSDIWCGDSCSPPYVSLPGFTLNPTTLRPTMLPPGPLGQRIPAYLWTGRAIIAVNVYMQAQQGEIALYDPSTGRWQMLPTPPGDPGLAATPLWAGTQLLELTNSGYLWSFHR